MGSKSKLNYYAMYLTFEYTKNTLKQALKTFKISRIWMISRLDFERVRENFRERKRLERERDLKYGW